MPRLIVLDLLLLAGADWAFTQLGITIPHGVIQDAFGSFLTNTVQKLLPYLGIPLAHTLSRLLKPRALVALLLGTFAVGAVAVVVRYTSLPSPTAVLGGLLAVSTGILAVAGILILGVVAISRWVASDDWLDQHVEGWTLAGPLLKADLREHGPFYFGGGPPDPLEHLSQGE